MKIFEHSIYLYLVSSSDGFKTLRQVLSAIFWPSINVKLYASLIALLFLLVLVVTSSIFSTLLLATYLVLALSVCVPLLTYLSYASRRSCQERMAVSDSYIVLKSKNSNLSRQLCLNGKPSAFIPK
jgi:hypothetical protein